MLMRKTHKTYKTFQPKYKKVMCPKNSTLTTATKKISVFNRHM